MFTCVLWYNALQRNLEKTLIQSFFFFFVQTTLSSVMTCKAWERSAGTVELTISQYYTRQVVQLSKLVECKDNRMFTCNIQTNMSRVYFYTTAKLVGKSRIPDRLRVCLWDIHEEGPGKAPLDSPDLSIGSGPTLIILSFGCKRSYGWGLTSEPHWP